MIALSILASAAAPVAAIPFARQFASDRCLTGVLATLMGVAAVIYVVWL